MNEESAAFESDGDDDDDEVYELDPEQMEFVQHLVAQHGGGAHELITNDGHWPTNVQKYHPLDMATTLAGLAANISASFATFFADVRRDLAAARNQRHHVEVVRAYDADVALLPEAVAAPEA